MPAETEPGGGTTERGHRRVYGIAVVLLLGAGAASIAIVTEQQFSSGGVYAEGSSFRTDPEGSAALYEALARTRSGVSRNFIRLDNLNVTGAAILILNLDQYLLSDAFTKSCETLAERGNRVTIAFDPESYFGKPDNVNRWNVRLRSDAHSQRYIEHGAEWKTVRAKKMLPFAIERQFGRGWIALVGDDYPFTNLALRNERDTMLVSWAIGEMPRVLFDESHLGSVDETNIMGLARRLRLSGVIAALVAAGLLFVWQSSVTFPPERPVSREQDFTLQAAGTSEGLRSLLMRYIAPGQLISTCVAEWRRDHGRSVGDKELAQLDSIAQSGADPLRKWEEIRSVLNKKHTHDR